MESRFCFQKEGVSPYWRKMPGTSAIFLGLPRDDFQILFPKWKPGRNKGKLFICESVLALGPCGSIAKGH
jgi:hypothetical protein